MTVDFSAYLEAICNNPKYTQWWKTYTVTDVVGKEISNRRGERPFSPTNDEMRSQPFLLDLGLMVQTVPKKEERENRQEEKEKIERFGVLEGLRKYAANHVLLRGKPGSGKSTALVRLLLEEGDLARSQKAKGKSQKGDNLKIPVLVELRSYKTSVLDLIQNFIAQNQIFVNSDDLETLLKEGKLLLLVDGVNELPSDSAYGDLQQFEQQYPQTAMIFTTRELGLRGDLNIEKKLTMEPLTEPQMQQFLKGYLPEKTAEAMLKQLGGRIKELGETPLLLWMLCSVFVQNQQEIPDNLGGVFRAFTSIYDDKLKAGVTTKSNSRILWSDSLKYLAFEMTKRKDEPAISATEAETILGEFLAKVGESDYSLRRCRLWLQDLLDYHLLQRRGQNDIEFRHQLIQEYYTAETLVLEFDKLTDEQLQWDYLNYLKWTEPMAVVAGLLREEKQAVRLVKLGLAVDLKLGARLAGEVNYTFQGETVDLVKNLEIPGLYKVNLLGRTKSEEAVSELEKALNHSDSSVRRKAVEALGKIGSDKAVESLKKALNRSNKDVHYQAVEVLGNIGSDKAIDSLENVLNDSDYKVRWNAVYVLGKIGSEKFIESLEKALNDSHEYVRTSAAVALGNIGSDEAIESLETALNDSDKYVRSSAAVALGNIGSDEAIESLETALNDSDKYVRRKVAKTLGNIGSEKAIESLETALNDSDMWVRSSAAEALGKIRKISSDKAIESLENALNDSDMWVRSSAAEALNEAAEVLKEILLAIDILDIDIESLETALNHSDESVRRYVAVVLGNICSDKAIESLETALNHCDMWVRSIAAEVLGKIGSEKFIESLETALNHCDMWVCRYAAEVLGKIGSDKAVDSLKMALNHSDEKVRRNVVEALGKIGSDKAVDSLKMALNHSDENVRRNVAEALGNIGSDKAIESLEKALNHSDEKVRRKAAEALGNIGSNKAIEGLENALNDSDEYVRMSAAEALGNIGSEKTIKTLSTFLLKDNWQYYNESFSRIINSLETIQDKCQIYQTLCLPFLKIPQNSLISDTKLTEYCLKSRQHYDKSRQLTQAGFSLSNPQQLKQAIQQLITENIVSKHQENDYGILYQVKGELNSINDKKSGMITVWLKRKAEQKIQFISVKIISDYD